MSAPSLSVVRDRHDSVQLPRVYAWAVLMPRVDACAVLSWPHDDAEALAPQLLHLIA